MQTNSRMPIIIGALLCAALTLLTVGSVSAQKRNSGVIRLEETVIEGRVQKPNAFFISSRQPLVYVVMELKESFISEISKAVESGPF